MPPEEWKIFKEGDTVRLGNWHGRPFGTPSQRRILWRVTTDGPFWGPGSGMDGASVMIERLHSPDSRMYISQDILIPSTLLDLMVARVDECEAAARE